MAPPIIGHPNAATLPSFAPGDKRLIAAGQSTGVSGVIFYRHAGDKPASRKAPALDPGFTPG
jgi:hypothetical protein